MNKKEKATLKYKITEFEGDNIRERLKLNLSKTEDYHRYLILHEKTMLFKRYENFYKILLFTLISTAHILFHLRGAIYQLHRNKNILPILCYSFCISFVILHVWCSTEDIATKYFILLPSLCNGYKNIIGD